MIPVSEFSNIPLVAFKNTPDLKIQTVFLKNDSIFSSHITFPNQHESHPDLEILLLIYQRTIRPVNRAVKCICGLRRGRTWPKEAQVKSSQVKTPQNAKSTRPIKCALRTFHCKVLPNRPLVSPFDFNCAILRPKGPLVYATYAREIWVTLVPVWKNAMRAECFSKIDFSESYFFYPQNRGYVFGSRGCFNIFWVDSPWRHVSI